MTSNADIVLDQFTRQAEPFANSAAVRDEDALRLLVEFSGAGPADTVLDVACGPGRVVAAFAKVCRHAIGIDLTPAMIDKAREHAAALGLTNVDWLRRQCAAAAVPGSRFLGRGVALRVPSLS
jgi:ubiquinone/menaquinone biosynthesis C-methylase UbiE